MIRNTMRQHLEHLAIGAVRRAARAWNRPVISNTSAKRPARRPVNGFGNDNEPLVKPRRSGFAHRLAAFALLLGSAFSVQAGTVNCSDFVGGVIDGFDPVTFAAITADNNLTLAIDGNCTIRNWPEDNGWGGFDGTNINFYFPGGADYYIVFDNVYYPGNMSCNNPQNSNFWIYWAPGSFNKISDKCQEFMVPVDMVIKTNPEGQSTATIGELITYTITAPKLGAWTVKTDTFSEIGQYDTEELRNLVFVDDLTASEASLSYVTNQAYLLNVETGVRTPLNGGNPLVLGASSQWLDAHLGVMSDDTQHLVFSYENNPDLLSVPPGHRIDIELTVRVDDAPQNVAGLQFTNTADMWFDKIIEFTRSDGTTGYTNMTDLRAWTGTTMPMTLVEPELVVNKTSNATAVNIGVLSSFTITAENRGGADAWSVTIDDLLPSRYGEGIEAGMCDFNPVTDGVFSVSLGGTGLAPADYLASYDSAACTLSLTLNESAGPIAPGQSLVISYQSQLDEATTANGVELTNVAGATRWFNAEDTLVGRRQYDRMLTDGTPGVDDHEDSYTVTTGLSGYYFEKTVVNLATGIGPGPNMSAAPADSLRYQLRLFNLDQVIDDISISDNLDINSFDLGSWACFAPVGTVCSLSGNTLTIAGDDGPLNVSPCFDGEGNRIEDAICELIIEFEVTLLDTLDHGHEASNQATLTAIDFLALSDDPYLNGVADPEVTGDEDHTIVRIQTPGPLAKEANVDAARIGEQFSYIVTVPATPVDVALFDVRIEDALPSNVDLYFVEANVLFGDNWTLTNTGTDTELVIEDLITGIDIPAGTQTQFEIVVQLLNTERNQRGLEFTNTASYTYNRRNNDLDTQMPGEGDSSEIITVVEPELAMTKAVANVTPGKSAEDPVNGGDILEYTLTIPNNGTSSAYDVNITDFLPSGLDLVSGSVSASLDGGAAVALTDPEPDPLQPGLIFIGRQSGDSLEIPVDSTLVVTYRATVAEILSDLLTNNAYVDWTSLMDDAAGERTGGECGFEPVQAPDTYCYGPVFATLTALDTNAISKVVVADSWVDDGSTGDDAVARVGDTIDYALTLSLREGLTRNVTIADVLDPGLAFVEVVSINGMSEPYTSNGVFTHADILPENLPAEGATGTLTWLLGDIYNAVDDGTNDDFVIVYRARVQHGEGEQPAPEPTQITLSNVATLGYSYADGTPVEFDEARMRWQADLDVRQPLINAITKSGTVNTPPGGVVTGDGLSEASAYLIDIVNSSMDFVIQACNDGQAPAYGLVITDQLAGELDETSISNLQVSINDPLDPADYSYQGPEGRGGQLRFTLHTTLDPGACATINYTIGFHDDIAPNQTWFNAANVDEYWSRPSLDPADARLYAPVGPDSVWMTNAFAAVAPTKTADKDEATIGEEILYTITVPGEPVNAALSNVIISDTLDPSLVFVSASATLNGAALDPLDTMQDGQTLSWVVDSIPAGQQVEISLTARVANTEESNAGVLVDNVVAYSYVEGAETLPGGESDPTTAQVRIVEPLVAVNKLVSPDTDPTAGDLLTYTLTFSAESGADRSDAFDLLIEDTLSIGLLYEPGSALLNGVALADPLTNGADGLTEAQTLSWGPDNGVDIDIPAGEAAVISYQVRVLAGGPGAVLSNRAIGYWSSLDGDNDHQRTGDDCVDGVPTGINDYCTSDTTTLTIDDDTSFSKALVGDSWNDEGAARIGDTATYQLTLELQEGVTRAVRIADILPAGVALVDYTISSPSGAVFNYVLSEDPATGDSGTLVWDFGDITNEPSGDNTPIDALVIEYTVRVLKDSGLVHVPETMLGNSATMSYTTAMDMAVELPAQAELILRQPMISTIEKVALNGDSLDGSGIPSDPYIVDIVNDTMSFQLQACNDGQAPAYGVVITDQLAWELDETSLTDPLVRIATNTLTAGSDYTYTAPLAREGLLHLVLNAPLPSNECVTVEYQIGFHTDVAANQEWSNRAELIEYWSLDDQDLAQQYLPAVQAEVWMSNAFDAVAPTKAADKEEATIGEEVSYTIVVPGEPVNAALNDVTITDTLDPSLVFVSASATLDGTAIDPLDTAQDGQALSWAIATIPAGQQVEITLTTRVDNNNEAQSGVIVNNSASYTHEEGGVSMAGGSSAPVALRIVEPEVVVAKAVAPDVPPSAGDLLTYTLTFNAAGGAGDDPYSDAFDLTIEDTLSLGLAYEPGSATVDGASNSIGDPNLVGDGLATPQTLSWDLAEASIAIPEGGVVTVTYQVRVLENAGPGSVLENSVVAYWTSLSGVNAGERTGADCPDGLNDYCTSAFTQLVIDDHTALAKAVDADSWTEEDNTVPVGTVRIGDTVTYHLSLWLQEGTTRNVSLSDILPEGMEFVEFTISSPSGATFVYTLNGEPQAGDTGTIEWLLGNITNEPSNDGTPLDELRIAYTARIMEDAGIAHQPQITLTNTATLSYDNAQNVPVVFDPDRMQASADVTLYQPLITAISKRDLDGDAREGSGIPGDPYIVDIVNDTMSFQLEACNDTGLAPAYGVAITDQLAWELDETSLTAPVVRINGLALAAGDYLYTPPAGRAGQLQVVLNTPLPINECVTVEYQIGFHTDVAANQEWANSALVERYWSLPPANAQEYAAVGPAAVWMSNAFAPVVPSKAVVPADQLSFTIGEEVTYQIVVPSEPVNAALANVVIIDELDPRLEYQGYSLISGPAVAEDHDGATLRFTVAQIPAGEQVVLQVTARVANIEAAQAPDSIENHVAYTYDGNDTPIASEVPAVVTIVEPALTMEKAVENVTVGKLATDPAAGGDILEYTLTITHGGSADAYDINITDILPEGLALVDGSATAVINGVAVAGFDPAPTIDGATHTWGRANGDDSLDIPVGGVLELSYRVSVEAITAPSFDNTAYVDWTSLDGLAAHERTGEGCPDTTAPNEYCFGPATASIEVASSLAAQKTVFNLTSGESGANATPGDVLRYTITVENTGEGAISNFSLADELDALNSLPMFVAGSLTDVTVPDGATVVSSPNGGDKGTGLLEVSGLSLEPGETLDIAFTVTLVPVIDSGTVVLNQAQMLLGDIPFGLSDDPAVGGSEDPTETLIYSTPQFVVQKTSEILDGDPAVLLAGERLRYTITMRNIGSEDAINSVLQDTIPLNTTYIANSTLLNGVPVADTSGVSALVAGMLINAPIDPTPGSMPADPSGADPAYVATVSFEVTVNANVLDGTEIANQGYVQASGTGSGAQPPVPSDDPGTDAVDDPTRDLVGNAPVIRAQKTVALDPAGDFGTAGQVDPGDTLIYTFVLTNPGPIPATGVELVDNLPNDTTYVANSLTINGLAGPAGATLPLIDGVPVSSSDLTPPLPGLGEGTLNPGQTAEVTFRVTVNDTAVPGTTVIRNQGWVTSNELPDELTDADGDPFNGYQETTIGVGNAQVLTITKQASIIGDTVALAGGTVEYVVTVTNSGTVPASDVVLTDDLSLHGPGLSYLPGSASLNGSTAGVNYDGVSVLTGDYAGTYGLLAPGASATLRFRATLDDDLATGTVVTNTGVVSWNDATQTASADASVTIGSIPGMGSLSGNVWHDGNYNLSADDGEILLAGWTVAFYRDGLLLGSTVTDNIGAYSFLGIAPNDVSGVSYELRFRAPGAGPNTALLGYAHSPFTDELQRISDIAVTSGSNLQGLNLPIHPNGVVYDAVSRLPVAGATLTMVRADNGATLSSSCFDDVAQQGQLTSATGYYRFDLNFDDPGCLSGGNYLIRVTPPANGFVGEVSQIIPPQTGADTDPFSVPSCLGSAADGDAIPATTDRCEASIQPLAPPTSVAARSAGTTYYLNLTLDSSQTPGTSQIFNNHIPLDPELDEAVTITKTAGKVNVSRSDLVPYTITVRNSFGLTLQDVRLIDTFPPGFKYVQGSSRYNGEPLEPQVVGNQLYWDNLELVADSQHEIQLLFIVGAGVSEGEYINRAQAVNMLNLAAVSGEAMATVRVVPDPTMDCTDIIGKVFDDKNLNGVQDEGEAGIPGARLVSARGLTVTTDEHGRFHVACAVVPNELRGSNFILKLDDRSLPSGYRVTTENPRVQRATRGKMMKFNFGATIHHVVRVDIGDGVFLPGTSELREHWKPRVELLLNELKKAPSTLRISYLADVEREGLVRERVAAMKRLLASEWEALDCCYQLTIETEVFWRTGAPPSRAGVID